MNKSDVLIDALDYIKRFNGQTFVIKFGGELVSDNEIIESVTQDLILLNYVGIHPVVLHGGGKEISKAMEKLGRAPEFINGLRVTDEETMKLVEKVLVNKVNKRIVDSIQEHEGKAAGLSGNKEGIIQVVQKKGPNGEDLGFVGRVRRIRTKPIKDVFRKTAIPVVAPIGVDSSGQSYNVNADTAASKLAVALKASKLIILTNVQGVMDSDGRLIKELSKTQAKELIKEGTARKGMIPKLEACIDALDGSVECGHIIKAGRHAILEEVFTTVGTGTMMTSREQC